MIVAIIQFAIQLGIFFWTLGFLAFLSQLSVLFDNVGVIFRMWSRLGRTCKIAMIVAIIQLAILFWKLLKNLMADDLEDAELAVVSELTFDMVSDSHKKLNHLDLR